MPTKLHAKTCGSFLIPVRINDLLIDIYLIYIYIYACICIYECIFVCVCVYLYIYIHIYINIDIHICISIYIHLYIYIQIRIYISIYHCKVNGTRGWPLSQIHKRASQQKALFKKRHNNIESLRPV